MGIFPLSRLVLQAVSDNCFGLTGKSSRTLYLGAMSLVKDVAALTVRAARLTQDSQYDGDNPPSSCSVRFRPPREEKGVFSFLGRDALWGDIRRFFSQRSEHLTGQDWTPASVREVEKALLEDSNDLRGSFLGSLRYVCDQQQACDRGMTTAEASFLRRLRKKLESRTPFLKGAVSKHAEELLRDGFEREDWKSLLAICDLARVLGARTGRRPIHQPLATDAAFWEVLFGLSLQARSWNRLHKGKIRPIRPLDVYMGACIVPAEGCLPSLTQMRLSGADGSWMSGSLDRWLGEIADMPGDSLIPAPEWSPPWQWLDRAADQILSASSGTRGAIVSTVVRALQEMGWEIDRPKEMTALKLHDLLEEMAKGHHADSPSSLPKPTVRGFQDSNEAFETGTFSIFEMEGATDSAMSVPTSGSTLKDTYREEMRVAGAAHLASLETGLTEWGRAWWSDFLNLLEDFGESAKEWSERLRELQDPSWKAGFEDLLRFVYPAAVRPSLIRFQSTDRFPPEPRDGIDRPVVDLILAACIESLNLGMQQSPLQVVRRWQSLTDARLLPSHSPGWWSWVAIEGGRRLLPLLEHTDLPPLSPDRAKSVAIPQLGDESVKELENIRAGAAMDPVLLRQKMQDLNVLVESSKEDALRLLLTRF
jgi:hypothetical protein